MLGTPDRGGRLGHHAAVRWLGVGAAAALLVMASGCGGNSGASGGDSGDARISSFEVPKTVECGGKTSALVTVDYVTTGAAKVLLVVDGLPQPTLAAKRGSVDAPVHCDTLPHTFVLAAVDSAGQRTSQQRLLTTNA